MYFFAVVDAFVLVFGRSMSWYSLVWVVERGDVAFGSVNTTELVVDARVEVLEVGGGVELEYAEADVTTF